MSRSTLVTWAVFTALLSMALFVAACSSDLSGPALVGAEPVQAASQEAAEPAAADPAPQEEVAAEAAAEEEFPDEHFANLLELDPSQFDHATTIDNPWKPLKPGTQYVYEGITVENGEEIPHRIIFTVTDLTKVINGVRTVVILDQDISDDALVEAELTFFAQDNEGNVWHLGQYRETYDETEFVGGRVWLVDLPEGAKAGIMMKAHPEQDSSDYSQGYAPAPFNWTDRARVYEVGQQTCVPYDCFDNVLVIEEYNQEEPGAFQLKYYAQGVGVVRVGWRGDDSQQETLELVEVIELDEEALAKVRAHALELEERAYMYSRTQPAELLPAQ
ncbi:MAG: hypothetical protein KatS3mg050_4059 [Litorilinea sp.]|nr:MAG: hypothetical protein KatS3mg050_4059 [Litorilinea sp.]